MITSHLMSRVFYKLYILLSSETFSPNTDDIYLVSYPRSGNTWMRVIMSELLYGESGESIKDLQHYVPDIHVKTRASDVIDADRHIVKSHYTYRRSYGNVVYIVRDPRDVVLSHYRYQEKLKYHHGRFDQFLLDWVNGRIWPCSWLEHVNSWTGRGIQDRDLLIIRYENLLSDAVGQICKIIEFFRFDVNQEAVERAVAAASVEKMRLREKHGMREEEKAEGFQFIGPATSNQWQDKMTSAQVDLIVRHSKAAMERHGYV